MRRFGLALAAVVAFITGFAGTVHAYDYHMTGWSTVVTDYGGNDYQLSQTIFYYSHTNNAIDLHYTRGEMSIYGSGDRLGCATLWREWNGGTTAQAWMSPTSPMPVTDYAYIDYYLGGVKNKTNYFFTNQFSAHGWAGGWPGNCWNMAGPYEGHGWLSTTNGGTTSWTDWLENY